MKHYEVIGGIGGRLSVEDSVRNVGQSIMVATLKTGKLAVEFRGDNLGEILDKTTRYTSCTEIKRIED